MNDLKPSKTAYKVALNILTLGEKPEMDDILPPGIVDATEKLLIASDAVGARTIRWSRSSWMIRVYEAFDWMMPVHGQNWYCGSLEKAGSNGYGVYVPKRLPSSWRYPVGFTRRN